MNKNDSKNYSIQLFRLISSIMVVAIHTYPFVEVNKNIAFGVNEVLSRVAVPFFFCLAGYFYIKNKDKENYLKNYIIKILKIYVVWGAIYLPYSFIYQAIKSEKSVIISATSYIRNIVWGGLIFTFGISQL